MGLNKKKNVIYLTICVVVSFTFYQIFFFLTITSEANKQTILVLDREEIKKIVHFRTEADVHINEHGVIKGVLYLHMPKYRPDVNNEFKCLNSDQRIPFDNVNDDYCDCGDETDEPSTNACPNGTFYCDTQYHKKSIALLEVPSSKVNDGICDCCDGSDEWVTKHKLLSQSNSKHYRFYLTKCLNQCEVKV